MILSMIFLAVAAAAYGITSRIQHGNFKWSRDQYDYWGNNSGRRKYRFPYLPPTNNLYAKLARLSYRESFPLSATVLVSLTDGFHMTQFFVIKFIILAVIFFRGEPTIWTFLIAWAVWCVFFNITYVGLKKKKSE